MLALRLLRDSGLVLNFSELYGGGMTKFWLGGKGMANRFLH